MDPISELIFALRDDGKPPLAWVVRWSDGDRSPVQAAWDASGDPYAMGALCRVILGGEWGRAARRVDRSVAGYTPPDELYAVALRAAVPTMPTMQELILTPWMLERHGPRRSA